MEEKNIEIDKNIEKLKKYDSELKFNIQNTKVIVEQDAMKAELSDGATTTGCKFVSK